MTLLGPTSTTVSAATTIRWAAAGTVKFNVTATDLNGFAVTLSYILTIKAR
jgi:hypothetical protein